MVTETQLIKNYMENYPEAGAGNSLKCVKWNYEKMEFDFWDEEEEKSYKVDMKSLKKGLKVLLEVIRQGKYFNNGVVPNLISEGYDDDAQDHDALVQCAIFKEVIYG